MEKTTGEKKKWGVHRQVKKGVNPGTVRGRKGTSRVKWKGAVGVQEDMGRKGPKKGN